MVRYEGDDNYLFPQSPQFPHFDSTTEKGALLTNR